MKTITTTTTIGPDRLLTVQLPLDVALGKHEVVVVLNGTATAPPEPDGTWPRHDDVAWPAELNGVTGTYPTWLPPPHQVGLIDPSDTFRREDIYGDDGR